MFFVEKAQNKSKTVSNHNRRSRYTQNSKERKNAIKETRYKTPEKTKRRESSLTTPRQTEGNSNFHAKNCIKKRKKMHLG